MEPGSVVEAFIREADEVLNVIGGDLGEEHDHDLPFSCVHHGDFLSGLGSDRVLIESDRDEFLPGQDSCEDSGEHLLLHRPLRESSFLEDDCVLGFDRSVGIRVSRFDDFINDFDPTHDAPEATVFIIKEG